MVSLAPPMTARSLPINTVHTGKLWETSALLAVYQGKSSGIRTTHGPSGSCAQPLCWTMLTARCCLSSRSANRRDRHGAESTNLAGGVVIHSLSHGLAL